MKFNFVSTVSGSATTLNTTWWLVPRIVVVGYNPGYKWDKWGQCPLISGVITHLLSGMKWDEPPSIQYKT